MLCVTVTAPVPSETLPVPLSAPVMPIAPVVALPSAALRTTPPAPFRFTAPLFPVFVAPLMVNAPLVETRLMAPLGLALPVVAVNFPAIEFVTNTSSATAVPVPRPVFATTTTLPAVT